MLAMAVTTVRSVLVSIRLMDKPVRLPKVEALSLELRTNMAGPRVSMKNVTDHDTLFKESEASGGNRNGPTCGVSVLDLAASSSR